MARMARIELQNLRRRELRDALRLGEPSSSTTFYGYRRRTARGASIEQSPRPGQGDRVGWPWQPHGLLGANLWTRRDHTGMRRSPESLGAEASPFRLTQAVATNEPRMIEGPGLADAFSTSWRRIRLPVRKSPIPPESSTSGRGPGGRFRTCSQWGDGGHVQQTPGRSGDRVLWEAAGAAHPSCSAQAGAERWRMPGRAVTCVEG